MEFKGSIASPDLPDNKKKCNTEIKSVILLPTIWEYIIGLEVELDTYSYIKGD